MSVNESTATENGPTKWNCTSLRKMECLSCKTVVFPPVMQCKYWHSVCNFCRKKLDTCPDPDCGESIDSATRSTVAENFLQKHVIRCKYFKEGTGCLEAKLRDEADLMQAHETICHFREIKCLVPFCFKMIRFASFKDHLDRHKVAEFSHNSIYLNTSQMILKKQILNETCGERPCKTALAYTTYEDCIFLVQFRMTSLRLPVFEISSIVYPFYSQPSHKDFRCKICARNEDDPNAFYAWIGPVNQTFPLTPQLTVRDELAKLKWIVTVEIFST